MGSSGEKKVKKKVIYMDVGSWQCREGEAKDSGEKGSSEESQQSKVMPKPFMTFGLIEHNAVALCTYFPMEEYKITPRMERILAERHYEFHGTLIERFLTRMMRDKYFGGDQGMDLESAEREFGKNGQSYHVRKLISFQPNELLDDPNKLVILIPDLHLHFFKGTYLDNFVTFYQSSWIEGKPVDEEIDRTSMERDFATFFKSIREFRDEMGEENIEVRLLGDVYEMWESLAAFHFFRPALDSPELQKKMEPVVCMERCARWLSKVAWFLQPINKFWYKLLTQIKDLNLSKWNPEVSRQMVPEEAAYKDWAEIHNRAVALCGEDLLKILPRQDLAIPLNDAARNLADAIAVQYKAGGQTFKDLFRSVPIKTYRSNHDNFLVLEDLEPLVEFICFLSKMTTAPLEIDKHLESRPSNFIFCHGHELDPFNSDKGCAFGLLITSILVLFEASERGDLFKHYQHLLTQGGKLGKRKLSETEAEKRATMAKQRKQVKMIARILQQRDAELNLRDKHLILVQAHTHVPYLREITESCWKVRHKLRRPKEPHEYSLPRRWFMKLPYDELGF